MIKIEPAVIVSATQDINNALIDIKPINIMINFKDYDSTDLAAIEQFTVVNDVDFNNAVINFENNLVDVLRSVGASAEAYEFMQTEIAKVIDEGVQKKTPGSDLRGW